MERSNQVLAKGMIDAGLATNRAIHLRQQGRRHVDDPDAAQVGGGGEPDEVADDTAAHGNDYGGAIGMRLDQRIVHL